MFYFPSFFPPLPFLFFFGNLNIKIIGEEGLKLSCLYKKTKQYHLAISEINYPKKKKKILMSDYMSKIMYKSYVK